MGPLGLVVWDEMQRAAGRPPLHGPRHNLLQHLPLQQQCHGQWYAHPCTVAGPGAGCPCLAQTEMCVHALAHTHTPPLQPHTHVTHAHTHTHTSPCAPRRLFLKKLRSDLRIPVLALVDSDPYGLKILAVYMKVCVWGGAEHLCTLCLAVYCQSGRTNGGGCLLEAGAMSPAAPHTSAPQGLCTASHKGQVI